MSEVIVRDMTPADETYVASSSLEGVTQELDEAGRERLQRLRALEDKGLRVKVALLDNRHAGVAYVVPIEHCPWCATGKDLMALPCMYVHHQPESHGVGRALVKAAEDETRAQHRKGIAIVAYRDDFWPVAPAYFKEIGYKVVGHRGPQVIMWKECAPDAESPRPVKRRYRFKRIPGRVVVDLFHNTLCRPSVIEARRVRELVVRFGGKVVLHDHCTDDRSVLLAYGIPRAILINGREMNWGYAAPEKALAQEISKEIVKAALG